MYHTMYSSQMIVQIMGGQQASGQCPPAQMHTMHINSRNTLHRVEYTQYVPGHERHRMMQRRSYPSELLQLMGVIDIPPLRHRDYMQPNVASSSNNCPRQVLSCNSAPTAPPSHYNYRPSNGVPMKKPNWDNKSGKRSSYRNSYTNNEKYNSDSGFSSRSPTPNKHQTDGNRLTESSDERDSVISLEQGEKRNLHLHPNNNGDRVPSAAGLISSASAHQFYQNQRPVNYYHTTIPSHTPQVQNYQNKRKYHSGRNSTSPQRNQRSRKFAGVILRNYNVGPIYYIAPDRFLARSHLVEVTQTPDDLLNGSVSDELSQDIWRKFILNQQTEIVYRNKMLLWKYLYIYIKTAFPKYGLFLVGSTMNGFGSDNSDVDMCLLVRHTEMDQRNEAIAHLGQILKCLKRCDFIDQLELIQAKVPILKFHDAIQNLEVDLNCNNPVGIRNTHLLYCYSRIDWRVRPLVLVVKLWAQSQNINDAKNMTISSYSLVLMVIHFLQCGVSPPVLPCLHSLFAGKFGPHTDIHRIDIHEELDIPASVLRPVNRQPLGQLLVEFFRYYVTFDFSQYAISVRLAKKVPIKECRLARSYKNDPHQWKYLCIEEPFDLTNTARSVYNPEVFERIKHVFDCSYQKLRKSHDLSRIFQEED